MKANTAMLRKLAKHREALSEIFDAGVIAVTWQQQGKTFWYPVRFGNDFTVEKLIETLAGSCEVEMEEEAGSELPEGWDDDEETA